MQEQIDCAINNCQKLLNVKQIIEDNKKLDLGIAKHLQKLRKGKERQIEDKMNLYVYQLNMKRKQIAQELHVATKFVMNNEQIVVLNLLVVLTQISRQTDNEKLVGSKEKIQQLLNQLLGDNQIILPQFKDKIDKSLIISKVVLAKDKALHGKIAYIERAGLQGENINLMPIVYCFIYDENDNGTIKTATSHMIDYALNQTVKLTMKDKFKKILKKTQ